MNWNDYYLSRINSESYDFYFSSKYKPLVDLIKEHLGKNNISTLIIEEGCGISSVSKQLIKYYPYNPYLLMDIDEKMLNLSKENLSEYKESSFIFKQKDILSPLDLFYPYDKILITHGVLEHFSDKDIRKIINNYSKKKITQFHYVPLNGYKNPSFGDERLLSLNYWINLLKINSYIVINNKDLYFKITPNK